MKSVSDIINMLDKWIYDQSSQFVALPLVQKALSGLLTKEAYAEFLLDYRHFVTTAGSMYALAAAHIDTQKYDLIKRWFFKQAYREYDHGKFIKEDLKALGFDNDMIETHSASPAMEALCCFNFGFIFRKHPAGLLGTPYIMTQLSSGFALKAAQSLKEKLKLDGAGASFFEAHAHLDKDQVSEIRDLIGSITDNAILEQIDLNAKGLLHCYSGFMQQYS